MCVSELLCFDGLGLLGYLLPLSVENKLISYSMYGNCTMAILQMKMRKCHFPLYLVMPCNL